MKKGMCGKTKYCMFNLNKPVSYAVLLLNRVMLF